MALVDELGALRTAEFGSGPDFTALTQPYYGSGGVTDPLFMARAWLILEAQQPRVEEDVIPRLEQFEGRWHPLGFLVVPLGVHENYGALRLHVWPENLRHQRQEGPGIHDHAWHLASTVLRGTYKDTLYDLVDTGPLTETERVEHGALKSFQVGYQPDAPDRLAYDGHTYTAYVRKERTDEVGGLHYVLANRFHLTTIPRNMCTATLVLDSLNMGYQPRVLFDTPQDYFENRRQEATTEELALVREQLTA